MVRQQIFLGRGDAEAAVAAGGNRVADISGPAMEKSFLGYPVTVSQVMPKVSAINQICCLFGNLRLARAGRSPHDDHPDERHALNAFEQDEVVIRGTERFDIVVHDVGNNAGTAGPIVGFITGAL